MIARRARRLRRTPRVHRRPARAAAREDLGARAPVCAPPWSSRSRSRCRSASLLGHLHRGSFLAVNVANIGRALPTLVVIAVGFTFLGLGFTNMMVALVILAVPPILTNAYVAVDEVDPDAVEAARGMGMTPSQVLRRVEIPLALPLLFAGIRTAAVFVDRDGDDRRDRRRRRSRRDPRQPGELRRRRTGGRGDLRVRARARRRRRARLRPARLDTGRTETGDSGVRTGCAPGRLTG